MYSIVEVGSFSYPKPTKEVNEDFLLLPTYDLESNIIFAIADGVGSSSSANKASECAINAISRTLRTKKFSVESALNDAKTAIDELTSLDEKYSDSATTLTIVQIQEKNVVIGHIGDCRAYVKKQNKLLQLTKDHTRYQELLDEGELSVRKLHQHRERLSSILTKALTKSYKLDFDIVNIPIENLIEDGVFNIEDGINIVSKRGEIMQNFTPKGNWKMAAILGLDDENVEEICKNISSGFVKPANYNTLGQVVVSGEEQAVLNAGEAAKKAGAKKVSLLNTSGPFHTEKLSKCSIELKKELDKISINSKNSIVIKNLDGKYYEEKDNISEILAKHIMNPVRFTECLKTMYESGIDTFIEIGPGKTLSGFVKRMKFENVKIMNINNVQSLEQVIKEVKENG